MSSISLHKIQILPFFTFLDWQRLFLSATSKMILQRGTLLGRQTEHVCLPRDFRHQE